jgi:hypothetical protein
MRDAHDKKPVSITRIKKRTFPFAYYSTAITDDSRDRTGERKMNYGTIAVNGESTIIALTTDKSTLAL